MLFSIPILIAASAVAGIVSHKVYWSRYEFDEKVPSILVGCNLTLLALTCAFYREDNFRTSFLRASLLAAVYVSSLFFSIAIYRLFCHPTRHFKGPFWSRLTTWWKVKHIARAGSHYGLARKLHEQYGETVRWGKVCVSAVNWRPLMNS